MRKLIALFAFAVSACNPELKAEKRAWDRCFEQKLAAEKALAECRDKLELDRIAKDQQAAADRCRPLREAAINISPEDKAAWLAAYQRQKEEPACAEEARLQGVLLEATQKSESCTAASVHEREMREADFLAACEKCAERERCEENLKQNTRVQWMRTHPNPETPAERLRLEWIKKELKSTELVFACDR